jgi:hypothetical protein
MRSAATGRATGSGRAPRMGRLAALALVTIVSGCGTTRFEAQPVFPAPLITRIPVVVGVYIPEEFSTRVHTEKRDGVDYSITLGKAQAAGFQRLLDAMFNRVVPLPSVSAGSADPEIRAVLEPVLEEFAFITPRDAGTPLFAVSLKYRVNAYTPSGQLADSWTFTGYAAQPSGGLPGQGEEALRRATGLAMRDAGAKLVTEFREQAIVRGLLPAETGSAAPEEIQSLPETGSTPPAATTSGEPAASAPETGPAPEAPAEVQSASEPEAEVPAEIEPAPGTTSEAPAEVPPVP